MITDQRQTGKGWQLVSEVPDWVREPRKYDFQLSTEVQLQLVAIHYLDIIEYPASLGRRHFKVTDSKVETVDDKRCEVLIPERSKVEYAAKDEKASKRSKAKSANENETILHIADVLVDGRRPAQLSFERCSDGQVRPKLHFYASGVVTKWEGLVARH